MFKVLIWIGWIGNQLGEREKRNEHLYLDIGSTQIVHIHHNSADSKSQKENFSVKKTYKTVSASGLNCCRLILTLGCIGRRCRKPPDGTSGNNSVHSAINLSIANHLEGGNIWETIWRESIYGKSKWCQTNVLLTTIRWKLKQNFLTWVSTTGSWTG